jgi:hypothetical protein
MGLDRPTETFELERPERFGDETVLQPGEDTLTDHNLARARQSTQTRGEVHDAPDRGVPVIPLEPDSTHGRETYGQTYSEPQVEAALSPSRSEPSKLIAHLEGHFDRLGGVLGNRLRVVEKSKMPSPA